MKRRIAIVVAFWWVLSSSSAYAESLYQLFRSSADRYGLSVDLLVTVARVESGGSFPKRLVSKNADGSTDHCLMQINSTWERKFPGIVSEVDSDIRKCIEWGAYFLADCIHSHQGDIVEGVGCYNAISSNKRKSYADRVAALLGK